MNAKQAKRIRQALLPNPRHEVGASRGSVMRELTRYEQVQPNPQKPKAFLILKPGCPRQVYQSVKRRMKRERNRLEAA